MRSSAQDFFIEAAETYFEQRMESEKEAILRNAILIEIRAASDWRKQLGISLLTAIVAPLLLGGLIAAALFYSSYLTPAEVAKRLHPPASEQPPPNPMPDPGAKPSTP